MRSKLAAFQNQQPWQNNYTQNCFFLKTCQNKKPVESYCTVDSLHHESTVFFLLLYLRKCRKYTCAILTFQYPIIMATGHMISSALGPALCLDIVSSVRYLGGSSFHSQIKEKQ